MSEVRQSVQIAGTYQVYDTAMAWTIADGLSAWEAQHLVNELNRITRRR